MRAAIVSTRPEPIPAAGDGDGAFEPVPHEAALTAHRGIAAAPRLSRTAPAVVGEPPAPRLAAVDPAKPDSGGPGHAPALIRTAADPSRHSRSSAPTPP